MRERPSYFNKRTLGDRALFLHNLSFTISPLREAISLRCSRVFGSSSGASRLSFRVRMRIFVVVFYFNKNRFRRLKAIWIALRLYPGSRKS